MKWIMVFVVISCKNIDGSTTQQIDIDGHPGWYTTCPDYPSHCYEKAGKTCSKGYSVVSETIRGDFKYTCR